MPEAAMTTSSLALGCLTGILLSLGQYFMRRTAISVQWDAGAVPLFFSLVRNPNVYVFVAVNLCATAAYITMLRTTPMILAAALAFLSMSATITLIEILVLGTSLSVGKIAGLCLTVVAVLLLKTG
jgi:hypothetical protein